MYVCVRTRVCVSVLGPIGVPRTRGNFGRFHSQTVAVAKEIRVSSVTNDRHVINRLLVSLRLKYAKCHSVLSSNCDDDSITIHNTVIFFGCSINKRSSIGVRRSSFINITILRF